MLERLLDALTLQTTDSSFTYSIVVTDNDEERSAEKLVSAFAQKSCVGVHYCNEPARNIALARNRGIQNATGDYIAFIDDDEFPVADWLRRLMDASRAYPSAGILGPVRPHFEGEPPAWVIKGRFCERPEHITGTVMPWTECRTGNVLFHSSIIEGNAEPFDQAFGTGGEDKDFFMRMTARGHVFVWCNEAIAYETVPSSRLTRNYMIKRALLRGRNTLKLSGGRFISVCKSAVAIPIYSLVLPIAFCFGGHCFMKYLIKTCDHLGKVLALVRLNPVSERQM
jgi:succinoglycan biosynthesis protein ExoM